jgi:hypothetical protein
MNPNIWQLSVSFVLIAACQIWGRLMSETLHFPVTREGHVTFSSTATTNACYCSSSLDTPLKALVPDAAQYMRLPNPQGQFSVSSSVNFLSLNNPIGRTCLLRAALH